MAEKHPLTPASIMAISQAYRQSAILFAGVRLGIFDALHEEGPLAPDELAASLNLDRRGADIILAALAALGLLVRKGGRYRITRSAAHYLTRNSRDSMVPLLKHNYSAWDRWKKLPTTARTGRPSARSSQDSYLRKSRRKVREFISAMESAGVDVAPALASMIDLTGVERMLDVGGGPGTHSYEIIRRKRSIKATILDLPLTLEVTRELVKDEGLEENIVLKEGDFLVDDYGKGYDLVLMSNVLHSNSDAECRIMIKKAHKALRPGGKLVIKEYALDDTGISPLHAALFSVNMLISTSGGRTYERRTIKRWLREEGFRIISDDDLLGRYVIITGKKVSRSS